MRFASTRNAGRRRKDCTKPDGEGELSADLEQNLEIATRRGLSAGVVAFDRGLFEVAIDYFLERTFKATPEGPSTEGDRTALAARTKPWGKCPRLSRLTSRPPARNGPGICCGHESWKRSRAGDRPRGSGAAISSGSGFVLRFPAFGIG